MSWRGCGIGCCRLEEGGGGCKWASGVCKKLYISLFFRLYILDMKL